MNNELTITANSELSAEFVDITKDDVKNLICPNANDKEIEIFRRKCNTLHLNPFLNEIYLVKYGNTKAQEIVNYTTYIQRGEKTGVLSGWNVQISEDKQSATITIYRKDWDHPFTKTIWRSEFDKKQSVWKEKPIYMLEKVAIACGFRQCFSLTELPYTEEEIQSMNHRPEKNITPKVQQIEVNPVLVINELKEGNSKQLYAYCNANRIDIDNPREAILNSIKKRPNDFVNAVLNFQGV